MEGKKKGCESLRLEKGKEGSYNFERLQFGQILMNILTCPHFMKTWRPRE
jgi:hypothetical protein